MILPHLLVSDDYITWTLDRALTVQIDPFSFFVTPSSMFIDDQVSTNGGETWTYTYVPVLPPMDAAESANGTIVMAAGDILVSRDNGLTWTQHPFSKPQVVKWLGPTTVIVAGENAIAYSSDDGATWQSAHAAWIRDHGRPLFERSGRDRSILQCTGLRAEPWADRRVRQQ